MILFVLLMIIFYTLFILFYLHGNILEKRRINTCEFNKLSNFYEVICVLS